MIAKAENLRGCISEVFLFGDEIAVISVVLTCAFAVIGATPWTVVLAGILFPAVLLLIVTIILEFVFDRVLTLSVFSRKSEKSIQNTLQKLLTYHKNVAIM